ncbi:MAG: hypothetical protein ACUVQG_09320 [Thermogutta sp.]
MNSLIQDRTENLQQWGQPDATLPSLALDGVIYCPDNPEVGFCDPVAVASVPHRVVGGSPLRTIRCGWSEHCCDAVVKLPLFCGYRGFARQGVEDCYRV